VTTTTGRSWVCPLVRPAVRMLILQDYETFNKLRWFRAGWAYGEAPSYKGEAPPDPGHVLKPADEVVALTPKAAAAAAKL
jgi:hypothetical protein